MKTHAIEAYRKPLANMMIAILIGATAIGSAHANSNEKEDAVIMQYTGWGDPEMAQIAVNSGRALLAHLQTAKALLEEGKVDQAQSALRVSREFADAIERSMPYMAVIDEFKDASNKVVSEDIETFTSDLLPIYATLDELELYAPKTAKHARGELNKAKHRAENGNQHEASELLQKAAVGVSENVVYLPVVYVDRQVNAALSAVDKPTPDLVSATTAVNRALDSVTTVMNMVTSNANG